MARHLLLLLCLGSLAWTQGVLGARVYMELNGQSYSYNTDEPAGPTADLSPNYELPQRTPWTWTQAGHAAGPAGNILDFSTPHMSHTQHMDASGTVLGKYSYYDAAGYHELSYKAGAGIGFVVMGGNLAEPTEQAHAPQQSLDNLHSYR